MNDRDEFAAAALKAIIANLGADADPATVAELSFNFANAMMVRRRYGDNAPVASTGEALPG
jgi:hypothetical protein